MLKVYMTGLVYIHGCTAATPHAYLPDGTGEGDHHASLWADATAVDSWSWPEALVKPHDLPAKEPGDPDETVRVFEFLIPKPHAIVSFPETASTPPQCVRLESDLAKLKVKVGPGDEVPFDADPEDADIIAEVPIHGGVIEPFRFKNVGVIRWSIPDPSSLQVIATVGDASHTLTLKSPASGADAEIVLSNLHDVEGIGKFGTGASRESGPADHFELYKKLNRKVTGNLVAPRQPGHVDELSGFSSAFLQFIRKGNLVAGETPGCCSG